MADRRLFWLTAGVLTALCRPAAGQAERVRFTEPPSAKLENGKVKIRFAVSAPTDVEVAVVDASGKVLRHLAAGVLGAAKPPSAPLQPGLSQSLLWDRRDDFGRQVPAGPVRVRVRAGLGAKFGRFIGGDPYTFGRIVGIAADEDGNVYLLGFHGLLNQRQMTLRVFDPQGRYLREIMPFPADLPPGAMKDLARWDQHARTFRPANRKNLNPDFYGTGRGAYLKLVSASKKNGVVLTDGTRIYTLQTTGAVRGERFATRLMWNRKLIPWGHIPNSGRGPVCLAVSPDGRYAYLAGIFTCKTKYGHKLNPALPPGRIYRMSLEGSETMKEFVTIPVDHVQGVGGAWTKGMGYAFSPRGPVHGLAVDAQGRLYVCDRQRRRIAVFDVSGKELTHVPVAYPDQVAVHPRTGAVYVMEKDRVGYGQWYARLLKFDRLDPQAKPSASYAFDKNTSNPQMALSVAGERTVVWVAGAGSGLVALADEGEGFTVLKTHYAPRKGAQLDWNRLAVDYDRDEVYVNNGASQVWRYDGRSGTGGLLRAGGKPFWATDLAVGYDGLLYVRKGYGRRLGTDYSGPLERYTRDLAPAPYQATGTHVLSRYIYSRYGIGYAERGIGVGPDGSAYLSFMYRWVAYMVGGFGPDGRPLKGRFLKGKIQADNFKRGQNPQLDSAVIGPVPAANGGIRVDLAGNIYVGMRVWPKGLAFPAGFEKDAGYLHSVGSVVKFAPTGGQVGNLRDNPDAAPIGAGAMTMMRGEVIEGALAVYPGLAPFSHAGFGGNTCCVCRVPRFDVDRYGRVVMPNAITNSVRVVDNAGNEILEFGKYGNFDSQWPGPDGPIVAVPDIPLTWPTGAGCSEQHIYVNDTYSRRVVRVDLIYALQETADIP